MRYFPLPVEPSCGRAAAAGATAGEALVGDSRMMAQVSLEAAEDGPRCLP